jgi:hypothetical protein
MGIFLCGMLAFLSVNFAIAAPVLILLKMISVQPVQNTHGILLF